MDFAQASTKRQRAAWRDEAQTIVCKKNWGIAGGTGEFSSRNKEFVFLNVIWNPPFYIVFFEVREISFKMIS